MDKGVEKGKRSEEGENSMNQVIEDFFAKENGNGGSREEMIKSGFVSIVGLPNAGKSTLLNALVGQKIAITSKKAQTTRNQIMAVYDDERGQIVFHDTPGIHKAQNKLSVYMESVAEKALGNGDLILWIVDSTEQKGKKEEQILSLLSHSKRKILLVLNKIEHWKERRRSTGTVFLLSGLSAFPHIRIRVWRHFWKVYFPSFPMVPVTMMKIRSQTFRYGKLQKN